MWRRMRWNHKSVWRLCGEHDLFSVEECVWGGRVGGRRGSRVQGSERVGRRSHSQCMKEVTLAVEV